MAQTPNLPRLDRGLGDLAAAYDLVLCDVWGVIHNGVRKHEAAVEALRRYRAGGGTVVLITNAPAPAAEVELRLVALGIQADAYDAIATSGDVTTALIVAAGCPPLAGIGPTDETVLYREAARLGPRAPTLVPASAAELAVCIGLDDDRDTPEAHDDILADLRARDLELICANPDIVVEVGAALVFCAGAIAQRYAAMGGTVIQAGKPFPAIYERARALAAPRCGTVPPARVLAIGDAMRTDVAGAARQGVDALFVTCGIHRDALHPGGRGTAIDPERFARFLADFPERPAFALPDLAWQPAGLPEAVAG